MVVINVKKGDNDSFLYETTCDTSNDTLIRDLVEVWNMRLRLAQLVGGIREMGKHGIMKHPEKQGLDEVAEQGGATVEKGEHYCADPTGMRDGNGPGPVLMQTIETVAYDTEQVIGNHLSKRRLATTKEMLQEKLDNIRGVVTMAYPMGLPEWDTVRLTIEGIGGLDGTAAGEGVLDADKAELWVASRNFDRGQTVGDRLGRNEKTKVIGKLQKPGAGAPGRESAVSEDERKAMMAYYFKKQEELKALAENDDDDYLNSSWANPKSLQQSLRGQGNIRAPGI
jgi:cilia- and flagella-associated protein 298